MISLPIGLLGFLAMMALAAGDVNAKNYLNSHAFLVVFIGTAMVLMIGTPFSVLRPLFANILALFKRRPTIEGMREEFVRLSRDRQSVTASKDPLIGYAISLWERGLDQNTFVALLAQYRDHLETQDVESISSLQNISKYPPALGMLGTVMGMISLFANLGTSDKSALGPSLAVAMTATFYGLFLANGLIMPLADRIHVESVYRKKYFNQVFEILNLINRREPTSMIEEEITHREAA